MDDETMKAQLQKNTEALCNLLVKYGRQESKQNRVFISDNRPQNPFYYPAEGFSPRLLKLSETSEVRKNDEQYVPDVLDHVKFLTDDEIAPDMASPDSTPRPLASGEALAEYAGTVVALPPLTKK